MRVLRSALPASIAASALALGLSAPAAAHEDHGDPHPPSWKTDRYSHYEMDPRTREAWLEDCRRRLGHRDSGLGGAAIGGVIGGVAGNRIAGKGHRTAGTIAGAAVGAAAGMAIDKAEDRGSRDECEAYLEDYYARAGAGYGYPSGYGYQGGYPGYAYPGYGYAAGCCQQPMMMVPIYRQPVGEPECTETVEYEYIDEPVRAAPPRPVKRVKVVPDKRVKTVPDKRLPMK